MTKKNLKHATLDGKVKISINIPKKLMMEITEEIENNKISRTAWLTIAIIERLAKKRKEGIEN